MTTSARSARDAAPATAGEAFPTTTSPARSARDAIPATVGDTTPTATSPARSARDAAPATADEATPIPTSPTRSAWDTALATAGETTSVATSPARMAGDATPTATAPSKFASPPSPQLRRQIGQSQSHPRCTPRQTAPRSSPVFGLLSSDLFLLTFAGSPPLPRKENPRSIVAVRGTDNRTHFCFHNTFSIPLQPACGSLFP